MIEMIILFYIHWFWLIKKWFTFNT